MCTTYRQFMRALHEINQKPYLETKVNVFGRTVFTDRRDVADIDCVKDGDATAYRIVFNEARPSFPLLPGLFGAACIITVTPEATFTNGTMSVRKHFYVSGTHQFTGWKSTLISLKFGEEKNRFASSLHAFRDIDYKAPEEKSAK